MDTEVHKLYTMNQDEQFGPKQKCKQISLKVAHSHKKKNFSTKLLRKYSQKRFVLIFLILENLFFSNSKIIAVLNVKDLL